MTNEATTLRGANHESFSIVRGFFRQGQETFSNGHGIVTNEDRNWEDAYRNRWRTTRWCAPPTVWNCTGGCSWKIFVKNGLVSFEMQQTDYPRTREDLPNHEPRGCQRGASFVVFVPPHRIKYLMIRGRLLDLYRAEKRPTRPGRGLGGDPEAIPPSARST